MITICHLNVGWFFIFFDIGHSNSCLAVTLGTVEIASSRRFHFSSIEPKKPALEVMGFPATIFFSSKKSAQIVLNTCKSSGALVSSNVDEKLTNCLNISGGHLFLI